ncbi:hypothetical protein CK203_103669 [Vitis vinifera]|uniref:Retrotransposon gag domain-containing protein n=1 Tax=Vitis vinifera TaxID=29760 RepID=A0A438DNI3_VITVI|nr:hypothetical protein CK203_103669 [Vitis vinifera]
MYSASYRELVIRPHIVPFLPTFHGMESENPYAHIKEFEDVCNTFQEGGASIDLMRLKLFPFTLKDKAKIWLNSLRPRTKENEKFYECWERYMEAINACPHHGFDTWLLVSYFYDDIDMKAKVAAMTRRLEELELKKIREVQAVSETPVQVMPCSICQSYEHLVEECPTIPAVREMFGDQGMSLDNSSPTMLHMEIPTIQIGGTIQISPGSQEHFSTQPGQASQQASNLEQAIVNLSKVVGDFVGDQKSINAQLSQRIGRFPSQPHQNPKGIHEVEAHEGRIFTGERRQSLDHSKE